MPADYCKNLLTQNAEQVGMATLDAIVRKQYFQTLARYMR
jgi:hypothetical protein